MPTTPIKTRFSYTVKDFFGFYKKYKIEKKEKPALDYKQYKSFIRDFFVIIGRYIIEGHCFIMPRRLGTVTVIKSRRKYVPNYNETRKHGKMIFFLAPNTNGDYFQFRWIKTGMFNNRQFYEFKILSGPTAKKHNIGPSGLGNHILKVSNDPLAKSYPRK